ncbi:MAG: hypothetical protein IPK33_00460 [Gemmatimonadetes bacterium]|nr:hypothetical protein [Gemmatimonadota bacterium]
MAILRLLMLAIGIALGTVLLAWWVVPVVAAAYGFVMHRTSRPGFTAAGSGALAWGGYLALASVGGAPVGALPPRWRPRCSSPGGRHWSRPSPFQPCSPERAPTSARGSGGRYLTPA